MYFHKINMYLTVKYSLSMDLGICVERGKFVAVLN